MIIADELKEKEYDYDCYLMATPHFVGIEKVEDISRFGGYVHPLEERVAKWTKFITEKGKRPIGICHEASPNPVSGGRLLNRDVGYKNMARLKEVKEDALLYNLMAGMRRRPLLQAQYDALSQEEKKNSKETDIVFR